ncbi:MAG: hypothetical protein U1E76_24790 [Planctomycetota bacterium]
MKLQSAAARVEALALTRPYTVAFRTISAVEIVIVELRADGMLGLGAASPEPHVTGETNAACQAALAPGALAWLLGRDVRTLPLLCREAALASRHARGARRHGAADLLAQQLGVPLVDLLGPRERCHVDHDRHQAHRRSARRSARVSRPRLSRAQGQVGHALEDDERVLRIRRGGG